MSTKCPHCQFDNAPETRFCGNCAAFLCPDLAAFSVSPSAPPTQTIRVCCGEIAPGAEFAGRYRICDELGRGGMGRVFYELPKNAGGNNQRSLKHLLQSKAYGPRVALTGIYLADTYLALNEIEKARVVLKKSG